MGPSTESATSLPLAEAATDPDWPLRAFPIAVVCARAIWSSVFCCSSMAFLRARAPLSKVLKVWSVFLKPESFLIFSSRATIWLALASSKPIALARSMALYGPLVLNALFSFSWMRVSGWMNWGLIVGPRPTLA